MNTDRFQGRCLINYEGYKCMDFYDRMPPRARKRLMESRYNICSACVYDRALEISGGYATSEDYIKAIEEIEAQLG